MPNESCHECHHTNMFSNSVTHLNCHNDQLNASFLSPKPQSLNFVRNIPVPILIMPRLVNKFKIIISSVPLTVLKYCCVKFRSRVHMTDCLRLSFGSRNRHHEFLNHALIFQLVKFIFITGFQRLLAGGHHFEFLTYQVHFSN